MWSTPSWPGGLYSIYNKAIFTISLACRAASFCLRHPRQNFFPGGHHVWWNSHAGIGLRIWIAILAVLGQTYVILFKQSLCLCSCVMSLTNSLCVSLRLLVISSLWTMPTYCSTIVAWNVLRTWAWNNALEVRGVCSLALFHPVPPPARHHRPQTYPHTLDLWFQWLLQNCWILHQGRRKVNKYSATEV